MVSWLLLLHNAVFGVEEAALLDDVGSMAVDDDWAVAKKERVGDGANANEAVAGTSRRRIERRWPLASPNFLAMVF